MQEEHSEPASARGCCSLRLAGRNCGNDTPLMHAYAWYSLFFRSSCNYGGARIHCSNAAGRVLDKNSLHASPANAFKPSSRGKNPCKKVLASGRAGLQLLESSECWVQLFAGPRMFGTRRALTFMGHESWAMKGVPRFMARPCLPACGISCATSVRVLVTRCESHGAPAAPTGAALCSCGCGGCRNES